MISVGLLSSVVGRLYHAPVEAVARLYRPVADRWRGLLLLFAWMMVVGGGTNVWFAAITSSPLRSTFEGGGLVGWLLLAPLLALWAFGTLGAVRAARTPGPRGSLRRTVDEELPESPIYDEHWRSAVGAAAFLDADLDELDADQRQRLRATIEAGVSGDPGNAERVVDRSDQDIEAFAANLAALAEHGEVATKTIEYLTRVDAEAFAPYAELLYPEIEGEKPDNRAMLALARIAVADPSHAEAVAERLLAVADLDSAKRRGFAAGALGILAATNSRARQGLSEFGEQRDPDVRAVAAAAERYYRDNPTGQFSPLSIIDERYYDDSGDESNGGGDATSTGTGGLKGDYSYVCEDCGATLWDLWDVTEVNGTYSCVVCGHELDDQEGAKKTYLYG